MKLAAFSDIHANLAALEAVLADIRARGVRRLLCAGDLVGDGPDPEAVVARVRDSGAAAIRGNVDEKILEAGRNPQVGRGARAAWTFSRLSPSSVAFLALLPAQRRLRIGRHDLLLVHGSPRRIDEGLLPELDQAALEAALAGAGARAVFCGHTHCPMVREQAGRLVVNSGSVGRPYDGDPRASYALVEIDKDIRAEIVRVSYDVEATARRLAQEGFSPSFAETLRRGRK